MSLPTIGQSIRRLLDGSKMQGHAQALRTSGLHTRRLHLACGIAGLGHGAKILPGWTNIDIEGDGLNTFAWDLTAPLPFAAGAVKYIYSEHFIEHLSLADGVRLLVECRRVLAADGVLRVSTPDLEVLAHKYLDRDIHEWSDMGWNPATPCDLLNEGLREWGHLYVYDAAKLAAVLAAAGFRGVHRCQWGSSAHVPLQGLETRPDHGDCIFEAQV